MLDKKEIIKNIREIMSVNLEVNPAPLGDEDPLSGGQNVSLDSMEFMELAFSLEQRFDVPFDEETVSLPEVMVSINTIADYILQNLQVKTV
jgi:acyl carrier protein